MANKKDIIKFLSMEKEDIIEQTKAKHSAENIANSDLQDYVVKKTGLKCISISSWSINEYLADRRKGSCVSLETWTEKNLASKESPVYQECLAIVRVFIKDRESFIKQSKVLDEKIDTILKVFREMEKLTLIYDAKDLGEMIANKTDFLKRDLGLSI